MSWSDKSAPMLGLEGMDLSNGQVRCRGWSCWGHTVHSTLLKKKTTENQDHRII